MGRIFLIIAAVTFFMTAAAGMGVYYFSQSWINKANSDAFYGLATGVAQSITSRTNVLSETLHNIAQSPDLTSALQRSDIGGAKMIVQNMSGVLPGSMAFRLLLASDSEPDTSMVPHLGYADLDLVKNTFVKPQVPLIQGAVGKNRHLAITEGILKDGKVIAVILASLSFDELKYSFGMLSEHRIYLELKQGKYVLFSHGDSALKASKIHTLVNVKNTAWDITYWSDESIDLSLLSLILSIILIPAFISSLACYISFRRLEQLLVEEQRHVLTATKDIMQGKTHGNYPIELKEMENLISNIIQFQRVLETKTTENSIFESENELDLDSFLESSEHSDELSSEFANYKIQESNSIITSSSDSVDPVASPISAGSGISLPDFDEPEAMPNTSGISFSSPVHSTDAIFRAYDIRGVVNETLTHEIVQNIGKAVGSEALDKGISTLVIAKDGRTSGPELSKALSDGILSTGINILDIGTVPTPLLYFVAYHHEDHSGIMLTGSHNPAEYNGLKIVLAGETLAGEKIQALKERIDNNNYHTNTPGTLTENNMFTNEYIGMIADDIRIARPMKVVIDAGNGVAGELGPTLLKTLGCEVIELFCDIDGSFPNHHPDPSKPENLFDLISAVKHFQADIGIAFDGDGDRMGVIDSDGKIIWPDQQMMLFSKHILAKKPGAQIIYDVKCSRHLAGVIKKSGGKSMMWKTGHSFMKAKVKQTVAAFAGEMSGHLYFNDRWFGFDDGIYSASRLIELLSEDTRTSAEVFADFPETPSTPELSIELAEGENFTIMEQLLINPEFPDGKITDIDGLRVDFSDGFGLVRASNTTPSLVVRFEGDTEEALMRIQHQFRNLILKVKPGLPLPF